MAGSVFISLLGPLEVRVGAHAVPVTGPKLRAIVAQLALANGRTVSTDELIDGTWGEEMPASVRNTLQYHVSVLRKALAAHGAGTALVTRDPGYALQAETDVARFVRGMSDGIRARDAGRVDEAAASLARALNEWHGHALADLREFAFAESRAVALESQRLNCVEVWSDAELACGRADSLVGPLQELVVQNPTRERLWEQLMIALYRTGRQDAALSAYRDARAALDRELGVAPSDRLRAVHQAVLQHDPKLAPVPALRAVPQVVMTTTTLAWPRSDVRQPSLIGPGGVRVELGMKRVTLGRHEDCELVLIDNQASRRHAEVVPTPDGFALADLGSTNGTHLNGVRVNGSAPLKDGDRIEIGHSVVRFVAGGEA